MKFKYVHIAILILFVVLSSFINKKVTLIKEQNIDSTKTELNKTIDSIATYKGKYKPFKKAAHASYYHDKFSGRKTASGKIFDNNKISAAHKKLPFGTMVKVTNEKNGKSVVVEIIDRGPYVKGREIDLSKKAFMAIANDKASGQMSVTLEIYQK